jgi:hypothetical protein
MKPHVPKNRLNWKPQPAKKAAPKQEPKEITILMLKLVSGENIIGKVHGSSETKLVLKDVVQSKDINYPAAGGIGAALYYSEWFPGTLSEHYLLNKDHIICAAIPSPRVIRLYVENLVKQNLRKQREKMSLVLQDDEDDDGELVS